MTAVKLTVRSDGDAPNRRLVAAAAGDRRGAERLRRLRDVGGAGQRRLLRRPVPVAVLLAVPGGELRAHHLERRRRLVDAVTGVADPADPARASASPATTTARRTTARSSGRRRRARCAMPGPATRGEARFPFILQNVHRYFFYLTLPFPIILLWDAVRGLRLPRRLRHGARHADPAGQRRAARARTRCRATRAATCAAATSTCSRRSPRRHRFWRLVSRLNARHMQIAWVSLVGVAADRPVRPPGGHRHDRRPEVLLMADFETHAFDVVVVGAGGAGLRAAIEAAAHGARGRRSSASRCSARPTP